MALFMAAAWIGFRNLSNGKWILATLALVIVVLALNDECFLSFPVFMALMFLQRPVQRLAGSSAAVNYAPNGLSPPRVSSPLNPVA
jgi:hypothetical protein